MTTTSAAASDLVCVCVRDDADLGPAGVGQVTKLRSNAASTAHLGVAVSLLALEPRNPATRATGTGNTGSRSLPPPTRR